MPVQINGKVRAKLKVPAEIDQAGLEAAAMADPKVQEQIAGKTIRKVIVVPKKMVNIVVGQCPRLSRVACPRLCVDMRAISQFLQHIHHKGGMSTALRGHASNFLFEIKPPGLIGLACPRKAVDMPPSMPTLSSKRKLLACPRKAVDTPPSMPTLSSKRKALACPCKAGRTCHPGDGLTLAEYTALQ